ncbi:MAG: TonB-dependent receptor [Polyangiaceae bacterium]|nr:TonB-dependent receptor [Polyangiaceae bacterium]
MPFQGQRCRRLERRLSPFWGWGLGALLAVTWVSPTSAQPNDATTKPGASKPKPPPLVPPKALSDTEVLRPAGTEAEADVLLELTIDERGKVTRVVVLKGEEPYASKAKSAAEAWRFRPALRGEQPVSARIRFVVHFAAPQAPEPEPEVEQPAPESASATETPPKTAPAPGASPPKKPPPEDEVVVLGNRTPPGAVTLNRAEVRQLPGAFGDPFRAIEALPGVTPLISGVPFFYVRGAPPGNVGYFLDGIRVPLLYHIGLGPSVIHPGIVKQVDLYPGGYPARFGRFAGGIVSGETAEPRTDLLHGEASVRLVDAGALVESPLAGGKGTALVAGRYAYPGLVLQLFAPEAILRYWDYQTRASYEVTPDDRLTLFSFGAYDYLGEVQPDGTTDTFFNTQFHRVDLRWDQRHSASTNSRTALYVGLDRTQGEEGTFLRDRLAHLRYQLDYRASDQATYSVGADFALDHYDVRFTDSEDQEDIGRLFPARTDYAMGAFGQVEWRPERWLTVTPGVRVDWYYSNAEYALAVEPRVSARYDINQRWRLIHALGVAHQPPAFVIPLPGFQVSGLEDGLQRSLQHSAGVETDLPWDVTASVTLFQNAFFNMTDALSRRGQNNDEPGDGGSDGGSNDAEEFSERALGHSYGVEVYVRRQLTKSVGGFISYTLSRSERSINRESFPSGFDRTHVLNLALSFNLGKRWRAGTRAVFYSGYPLSSDALAGLRSEHPERIPAFWRLDWRLEKRWRLGKTGSWALVFEVVNTTLNKETIDVECDRFEDGLGNSSSTCREEKIGPVTIPSIGVEAFF